MSIELWRMTEEDQRIVVPGVRICAAEDDYISGILQWKSLSWNRFLKNIHS